MKELIVATKNEGKVREFRELFSAYDIEVKSLLEFAEEINDIEETGSTFSENATIKAEAIAAQYNIAVIADDSGLEIDALNGAPGIYSARYAGDDKDDAKNLNKVMNELQGVPMEERTARFICAIAVARPGKDTFVKHGVCEGRIALEPIGTNGFGYDPIFIPENSERTMAQHTSEQKNSISHRHRAILKLEEWLNQHF